MLRNYVKASLIASAIALAYLAASFAALAVRS